MIIYRNVFVLAWFLLPAVVWMDEDPRARGSPGSALHPLRETGYGSARRGRQILDRAPGFGDTVARLREAT